MSNGVANPSTGVHSELSRDLTLFHITMMGLGMMIGAGVFVGIGLCMGTVGPGGLLVTFALNGLIAFFSAMSFAELASAIPRAGGAYNFARAAFGRPASFIAGWMEWLAGSAAGGFYAIVLSQYTLSFLYGLGWMGWVPVSQPAAQRIFGVAAALFFIYINFRGSSETGKLGALFTVGQMIFVGGIAVVGIITFIFDPVRISNFHPFLGGAGWLKLFGSMGVIYVAFEGFEVIAQAGDETIDPKRNLPKGILYSVLFVTLTYLAVAFATVVSVHAGHPQLGGAAVWKWISSQGQDGAEGFGAAINMLLPGWGRLLVTLAVIFSATSALNATIYSATRTSYALGRDRMLPKIFSKIHAVRKTPYVALAITSILVLTIDLTLNPKDGAATASMMFLMLFFLVNLCVIRIRRHRGDDLKYGYLMPLFPLFPILAIIFQAAMAGGILHESWIAWLIAGVWVPIGAVIFTTYSRKHAITTDDEVHVLFEDRPVTIDPHDYRIMVAVANPASALQLVRNTCRICQAKNAGIELIHMVPVPDQVPLSDAEAYMLEGKEAVTEMMLYLTPFTPVATTLRYCRNVARGIVSAVREKRIDMLIMGWHGQYRPAHYTPYTLGSTVDPILEQAPCNIVMLKNCGENKKFKKILVPIAGGPNSALAMEVADMIADPEEGNLTIFTCLTPGRKFDLASFVQKHRSRCNIPQDRLHIEAVFSDDVEKAIIEGARGYDAIVMGTGLEGRMRRLAYEPIPERIARYCSIPLVMVRATAGIRGWLLRYI